MSMIATTQSGTRYEFSGKRVRRVVDEPAENGMRRDDEWLELFCQIIPLVGVPMRMMLEPLGEGNVTVRTTSPVVDIEVGKEDPIAVKEAWND